MGFLEMALTNGNGIYVASSMSMLNCEFDNFVTLLCRLPTNLNTFAF
jgi:hypothetical protein